jgi:hypothetical protein
MSIIHEFQMEQDNNRNGNKWSEKAVRRLKITIGSAVVGILAALVVALSVVFTKKAPPPANPPDPPANVNMSASGTVMTVSWEQAQTGEAADTYNVTFTDQVTGKDTTAVTGIPMLILPSQDLPKGTYFAKVVAVNAKGESKPAQSAQISTPVPVTIDWNAVVDDEALTDAMAYFQQLTAQSHQDFWDSTTKVVSNNGKPRSYEDQLTLARYLSMSLLNPEKPASAVLDRYATEIGKNAVPPFPAQPRAANDPFIDPMPLWLAASKLQNKLGTADLPVRTQIFALVRCLEWYLGQKVT